MKKLLSIVLALSFVLCASAMFAVSAANTTFDDWTAKVGTATSNSGTATMIAVGADGMLTYNGDIYAGTVEIRAGQTALYNEQRYEILFGGKGIKASTGTTATAVNDDPNVSAYRVRYGYQKVYLDVTNDTTNYKNLASASVSGFTNGARVTTKIEWTEAGTVKIYVGGTEKISYEGAVPFGSELAIRGYNTYGVEVGFANVTPTVASAPNTGDNTSLYVVASTVILAATFAVVCISRKKRIAE